MLVINTQQKEWPTVNPLFPYNGLDVCVTYEVLETILPELDETTSATYTHSRDLQGPILEMNMRGLLVNMEARDALIESYAADIEVITGQLDRIIRNGLEYDYIITKGRKYQYPNNDQWKHIFYDILGLPVIRKRNNEGVLQPTLDRKALEKLGNYFDAEPFVRRLLILREISKKLSFLRTGIDPDGRCRASWNIAGTTTGRFSSAFSDFGTGTNLQNIENRLRRIFIPDEGFRFGNIDLEQSDSRGVGAILWQLFRDSTYLDACESGDLHTSVARLAFTDLPWTGERRPDRVIADTKFYRDWSYRDVCKRLGHGTNFMGEPDHMARETHIAPHLVRKFRETYLVNYPMEMWWGWVRRRLADTHYITTLRGRKRIFFGRAIDDDTVKAAVAYEPQSITADTNHSGLLRVWRRGRVQLLVEGHDSILFQYPEEDDEAVAVSLEDMQETLILNGDRLFMIPAEAKSGMNWGDVEYTEGKATGNFEGLKKWQS